MLVKNDLTFDRTTHVFGSWKFQEIRFIHFIGFFVIFSVFSRLNSYAQVIISISKRQKLKKRSEDENCKFHWDRSNLPEFNGLLCGTKFDVDNHLRSLPHLCYYLEMLGKMLCWMCSNVSESWSDCDCCAACLIDSAENCAAWKLFALLSDTKTLL